MARVKLAGTPIKTVGLGGASACKKPVIGAGLILRITFLLVIGYFSLVFVTLSSFHMEGSDEAADEQREPRPASSAASPPTAEVVEGHAAKTQMTRHAAPLPASATDEAASSNRSQERPPRTPHSGRFPRYGSTGFADQCNWTAAPAATIPPGTECTLLVRPNPKSNEGLAWWTGAVVAGYFYALQTGCSLLVDYGPGVDVARVLEPQPPAVGFPEVNWTVPDSFSACDRRYRCFEVSDNWKTQHLVSIARSLKHLRERPPLVPSPKYRFSYRGNVHATKTAESRDLEKVLPGFALESGMACIFNRLFRLAPTASEFVPDIFTKIFPAVMDEDALVIALYMRTGQTDDVAKAEESGQAIKNDTEKIGGWTLPQRVINCAIKLEGQKLASRQLEGGAKPYSRVVWMVVTDSPNVKKQTVNAYNGKMAETSGLNSTSNVRPMSVSRTVVTTNSRGAQTKPKRGPSTSDFAEALIDWYLVGESDLVIQSGGISFGTTGALRTARPIYRPAHGCEALFWKSDTDA